jgi:lathosterol oxidase
VLALVLDAATRVTLFLTLTAIVLAPLERAATGDRPGWRRRWRTHAPAAAALLLVNASVASAIAAALARHAPAVFDPHRTAAGPLRLAAFLLAVEVATYGLHRAMHASAWLWRVHRLHHQPDHLCWWDAWRQHPVDAALHVGAATALALVFQLPLVAHAPILLARKLYTSLLHADVAARRSPLAWIVATPSWHQRHHAAGRAPANFASFLACLDLVLGTWRPPLVSGAGPDRATTCAAAASASRARRPSATDRAAARAATPRARGRGRRLRPPRGRARRRGARAGGSPAAWRGRARAGRCGPPSSG